MNTNRQQAILIPILFGSIWGIGEATLGYVLHGLSKLIFLPGLSGFLMFPIGLALMHRAFTRTGKTGTLMATATVAAAIKLTNLALPFLPAMDTINPAMAILLEGAAATALFAWAGKLETAISIPRVFLAASGWKAIFLFIQLTVGIESGMAFADPMLVARFLLLDSVVNALLIVGYMRLVRNARSPRQVYLLPAGITAALAIVVNIGIALAQHGVY